MLKKPPFSLLVRALRGGLYCIDIKILIDSKLILDKLLLTGVPMEMVYPGLSVGLIGNS